VLCGALWCSVVLCGALWCSVVLCGAYGSDKRSLFLDCFYAVNEVVPEANIPVRMEGRTVMMTEIEYWKWRGSQ